MTPRHAPSGAVSTIVATRVRQLLREHDRSIAWLAAECAKAGAPHLTANAITNRLSRKDRPGAVTVDDLYALAEALSVEPARLLPPDGPDHTGNGAADVLAQALIDAVNTITRNGRVR